MVRIDIKALKTGLHEYEWDLESEALELDPAVFSQLHVHARLDHHPSRMFVTLRAVGTARLVCDRTLVEFDQPIQGEYSLLFTGPEFFEGAEDDNEGLRLLLPEDEEIDLTEAVRDTYLLSLPQRRIAPGAEAKEIPMQFGYPEEGDEVDPRWRALLALRSGEDSPGQDEGAR
jgi:uncharacterized protein